MDRIRLGDEAALRHLMERHSEPLMRYSLRLVQTTDAAEDVVQESFVRLWERRDRWRPGGSVRGFLFRTAHSIGIGLLRHLRVRERAEPKLRVHESRSALTPMDHLERGELKEIVQRAINELPPRRRQALVLTRIHGYSLDEAARMMELSRQTVANHATLALTDIARHLRGVDF